VIFAANRADLDAGLAAIEAATVLADIVANITGSSK
jgi:hypothetical protein